MGPVEAVRSGFKNALRADGRASRSEFWWFALFALMFELVALGIAASTGAIWLYLLVLLAAGIPSITLSIRRLHDQDRRGTWTLLGFVPLGGLVVTWFMAHRGTPGRNSYGPPTQPAH